MRRLLFCLLSLYLLYSCSTTKLVPDGMYRLSSNTIEVQGDKSIKSSLNSYIRQQSNSRLIGSWSPALSIYNWSNGSGKGINKLWESMGEVPIIYNKKLSDDSVQNLLTRLKYLGFYDAKVSYTADLNDKTQIAKVHYFVNTGTRKQIDSIVFELPEGEFADDFYADTTNLGVKIGDYLSEDLLEKESARSASYIRNKGYYDFNKNNYFFEADTLNRPGFTTLYYRIHPYTRNEEVTEDKVITKYTIGDVNISYPSTLKFNENKLLSINTIKPGMTYSEDLINQAYYRFSSLNAFNSVSIELESRDSSKVNCNINLKGTDIYGVKIDAEVSTTFQDLWGVSPKLSFYHKNIFGGGQRLNLDFVGNWQFRPSRNARNTEYGVSASLLFPQALGLRFLDRASTILPKTEIRASYNSQDRNEYTRRIISYSYGYIGQIKKNFYYQIYPLRLSTVKLFKTSGEFLELLISNPLLGGAFTDKIDLGVGATINYTSNSDIVPKTSYRNLKLSVDASGNLLSLFNSKFSYDKEQDSYTIFGLPYYRYIRSEFSFTNVSRFGGNDQFALAARFVAGAGFSLGNGRSLPFEQLFYCGGANSMRAWQVRTLGPGHTPKDYDSFFIIPSRVGDLKLEADLEFRYPLFWKLEGALFAEAGNIWSMEDFPEQKIFDTIALDWGLGIRVNLDLILLRLDAGFKLRDPSRSPTENRWIEPKEWFRPNGFAIHFGVGYPF